MTDPELDLALRALTDVHPDPALAGLVLAQLGQPARTTAALPWLVAAAAALVAVLGVSWYAERPMTLPGTPDTTLVLPVPLTAPDVPAGADVAAMVPSNPLTRVAFSQAADEDDLPWPDRLPAIRRAPLIEIDPIVHTPIHQRELAIVPLSIVQLEIASLER